MEGLNDTAENLMASIEKNEAEVSPSTLYGAACVLEGVPFINGAPQNTFVPGLIDLAVRSAIYACQQYELANTVCEVNSVKGQQANSATNTHVQHSMP